MNNILTKEINKSLRTAVSQFYYYPYLFFNESGFQHYFYAVFYRNKFFSTSNLFITKDGKKTNLIHPEYESAKRIPDKWRACYDMVILNPQFILDNEYDRITSKSIGKINSYKKDDLLAVFELKFIQQKSKIYKEQLRKDYESLKNAKEAKLKYMVVFDSVKEGLNLFDGMDFNRKDFKLVHIKVYFDEKNKKQIKVLIKPDNFLDLPANWLSTN